MAINLFTNYSDKIAEVFTLGSLFKGKTNNDYDFDGQKGIKVITPLTVDEVDMQRTGSARYGTPTDMQDVVQLLTMTRDKGFSIVLDKGDWSDQKYVKTVGRTIKAQLAEKSIPGQDKYFLQRLANLGGKIVGSSALTKTTAYGAILDIEQHFIDKNVPVEDRYLAIRSDALRYLKENLINLPVLPQGTAQNILDKGVIGMIESMKVIPTPYGYFPTGVFLVAWHKQAVLNPVKINEIDVKEKQVGYRGPVIEGSHYSDVFVLGSKAAGVYVLVDSSLKLATPTVTAGALKFTIAGTASTSCKYTTDGTDPRYSDTAITVSGTASYEVTAAAGDVKVKAVTFASGKFPSDVVESTVTVTAS